MRCRRAVSVPWLMLWIVWSLLLIPPASADAAKPGKAIFGLQPLQVDDNRPLTHSYFILDGHPGQRFQSSFRVTNSGTVKGTALLYPVDATTGQSSGTVYRNQGEPRTDVGSWLLLGRSQVTLAPHQSQEVPFTITIPQGARPGQHIGGIVAEQSNSLVENQQDQHISGISIEVHNLNIVAVQINLPGPQIERLQADHLQLNDQHTNQSLLISLRNTGTMMVKAQGRLQIHNNAHKLIQDIPLSLDTLLPQTRIDLPINVRKSALVVGRYHALLTLTYGHQHNLRYEKMIIIQPQPLQQAVQEPEPSPFIPQRDLWSLLRALPIWQIAALLIGLFLLGSGATLWATKIFRAIRGRR